MHARGEDLWSCGCVVVKGMGDCPGCRLVV
jgi:hypothetical protein